MNLRNRRGSVLLYALIILVISLAFVTKETQAIVRYHKGLHDISRIQLRLQQEQEIFHCLNALTPDTEFCGIYTIKQDENVIHVLLETGELVGKYDIISHESFKWRQTK